MWKIYAGRFHRWIALAFGLPLLLVILSGLALSFEPLLQQASPRQPITLQRIESLLDRHDPRGTARAVSIDKSANVVTIGGKAIDLASGEETAPPALASFLLTMRRLHETLLADLRWLVTASTVAMIVIVLLGTLLGWPQFRNSLRGWHQGAAWVTLPFLVLSPLTGLALALGISLAGTTSAPPAAPVPMKEAVRLVATDFNLADLTSIRQRGRAQMARIYVGGELRGFAFAQDRLVAQPRSWSRVVHEGNWGAALGPAINIVVSVVFAGLLATGLTMWLRRSLIRARNRRARLARA